MRINLPQGLAGALCGRAPGCSESTFQNGLKELLLNKFVASVKACHVKNHQEGNSHLQQ